MKIVLTLDIAKNGFIIAEGPAGVAVKSRCANSSAPNLILVEVPDELVKIVEKEASADELLQALILINELKAMADDKDDMIKDLVGVIAERNKTIKGLSSDNAFPDTQPEDVITTQREAKPYLRGTDTIDEIHERQAQAEKTLQPDPDDADPANWGSGVIDEIHKARDVENVKKKGKG
jgi:hypothetical protein